VRAGAEGKWLRTRPKIQCRACRHQVSLTAGTVFHATKLPLTAGSWRCGWSRPPRTDQLGRAGRRLGIKQTNAWALKQKIMAVMAGRENAEALDGRVEMDDAYLGGTARASAAAGRPASSPSWPRSRPATTVARGR
jgi:hypothetical protein